MLNTKYYSMYKNTKASNVYNKTKGDAKVKKDNKTQDIKEKLRQQDNEDFETIIDIFEKAKGEQNKLFKDFGQKRIVETSKTRLAKSFSSTVVFNGAKRAAQLSSCRNTGDVRYVMSLLHKDLNSVKACAKNGVCDEDVVSKVKSMIRQAEKIMKEIQKEEKETGERKITGLSVL